MNQQDRAPHENGIVSHLKARISRAQLIRAAGAGIALGALPRAAAANGTATYPGNGAPASLSFPFFPPVQGTYTTESILDILNAVITTRFLVADAVYFGITQGGLSGPALTSQQIGAARFQYEIDFFSSLGAKPVTTTATLTPALFKDPALLARAQLATAVITMSMFITATREFAELGQPTLAKWMVQLAAREAESVQRARESAGNPSLPNAFETDLFLYTRDGLDALRGLGLIGGSGLPVSYPGRDAMLAAAGPWANRIIQRAPNNAGSSITVSGPGDVERLLGERS